MKRMKRVLAMLLAMVMVLGMSVTALAADDTKVATKLGYPSAKDEGTVTISGIVGVEKEGKMVYPKVSLYKIAEADYKDQGVTGYTFKVDTKELELDPMRPSSAAITTVAKRILLKEGTAGKINLPDIVPTLAEGKWSLKDGTFTATIGAGAYIAIISGSPDGSVYNPIYLTVTYNSDGQVVSGNVPVTSNYLWGSTAVAKYSNPEIKKDIIAGTVTDEDITSGDKTTGEGQQTASLGKAITYQVEPNPMPSYPVDASNKTLFIADTMKAGLTFNYASMQLKLKDAAGNFVEVVDPEDNTKTRDFLKAEKVTVTVDGADQQQEQFILREEGKDDKVLGVVAPTKGGAPVTDPETADGFNINFDYDQLIYDTDTGAAYTPVIVYNAAINESAVIGTIDENGNTTNDVELFYANNPVSGSTHEGTTKPTVQEGGDISVKKDEEVVYTYKLAFLKTNDKTGNEKVSLAGAVFGIYKNNNGELGEKVGEMVSNESGFAISDQVEKGDYWVKEIQAPTGYVLNEEKYLISASYQTATHKIVTTTESSYKWSTDASKAENPDAPVQIGWAKDGKLYPMATYANREVAEAAGAYPAYRVAADGEGSVVTTTTIEQNVEDGKAVPGTGVSSAATPDGTSILEIPNTQLASLPSTGGIGTTIFTIGGCAIMVIAAGLFFATRRKAEK